MIGIKISIHDALKNGSMFIKGFLGKLGNAIQKIDYHISNDPEIVGKRFEDHVQNLFFPRKNISKLLKKLIRLNKH